MPTGIGRQTNPSALCYHLRWELREWTGTKPKRQTRSWRPDKERRATKAPGRRTEIKCRDGPGWLACSQRTKTETEPHARADPGVKSERQALEAQTKRSTDDALCEPKRTDESKSPGRTKTKSENRRLSWRMNKIGVNTKLKKVLLRSSTTGEKEDRTPPNQDAKQGFSLNSNKIYTPRRSRSSIPYLI
jgi:hypothetical protein